MQPNRLSLPSLGVGLGLRAAHYAHVVERKPAFDWFEVLSENYMHTRGRPLEFLDKIAERYPVVLHGVSMSIGSTDPLDMDYLRELKALRDRIGARWVSDHLCWTGAAGRNTHDLLPMPYTDESLRHVAARVRQVQDFLGAPPVLENPSTYAQFQASTFSEWTYLAELAKQADCGILLDVNNVYVSAYNHGFDPQEYFAAMPWDRVVQLHVAGHTHHGSHIIDSHIGPVTDPVWELLRQAREHCHASVLVEWDADIPDFDTTALELQRARDVLGGAS